MAKELEVEKLVRRSKISTVSILYPLLSESSLYCDCHNVTPFLDPYLAVPSMSASAQPQTVNVADLDITQLAEVRKQLEEVSSQLHVHRAPSPT